MLTSEFSEFKNNAQIAEGQAPSEGTETGKVCSEGQEHRLEDPFTSGRKTLMSPWRHSPCGHNSDEFTASQTGRIY